VRTGDLGEDGVMTRATLDKDPADVARMFDEVAPRYDVTNAVLSLGLDRTWRRAVARSLDLSPADRVLDLAAGTATSSAALARTGADVVGCDFSLGMLQAAKPYDGVELVAGDGLRLPFADASFDAVTISFGLRNVADLDVALAELLRVTRSGGRLVVCEFSSPTWKPFRTVYTEYLMRLLPAVATRVSSDPAAYVYLAESIRAWPDQAALAGRITAAGWSRTAWRDLTGGIVALHRAVKPA
jgi:demethylmenaquinone methyltransferase/2-methoxy-6-polyprenyl-1,4-benzoquinol methylase